MAKTKNPDLFQRLRENGMRKSAARKVADALKSGSKRSPKQVQAITSDLRKLLSEVEDRAKGGPTKRKAAAKKATATRKRNAAKRSASAKKAAATRKKSTSTKSTGTKSTRPKSSKAKSSTTRSSRTRSSRTKT